MFVCIYIICLCEYLYIYVVVYIYIYIYMYIYMCVYIYIYIYLCVYIKVDRFWNCKKNNAVKVAKQHQKLSHEIFFSKILYLFAKSHLKT